MLVVISPAKNLDYETTLPTKKKTQPIFLDRSKELVKGLRKLAPQDLGQLMGISDKLAQENYDRYQNWKPPFSLTNARQAMFAFKGEVYLGLGAYSMKADDIEFAQAHMRILSGLYGVLKPLDLIQAYRLEMGTQWKNSRGKDLYAFWGESITQELNKQLHKLKSTTLVNLASNEYFKSVNSRAIDAEIITPVFKDFKNGDYKVMSFFAKKARGLMSAYIIKKRIEKPALLKKFNSDGYRFNAELSKGNNWVFSRKQ